MAHPAQRQHPDEEATTEQLRADIDAGRTRDKVDYPDPAAAPLGTDAEAGGTPPSPQTVAGERARAVGRRGDPGAEMRPFRPWLVGLIVALAAIAAVALIYGA